LSIEMKEINEMTKRARLLRNQPTEAEAVLWKLIRQSRLVGYKFRRQHVIKKYILDFYCPALKLGIEVDGLIHKGNEEHDKNRSEALENAGICILRFRNDEILKNSPAVLKKVMHAIEKIDVQTPPPQAGEVGRGT